MAQDVKNFVTEKREKKQSDRCEYRAEDFTTIKLRPAKRAKKAEEQQRTANSKEQKISPGKITRDWKSGEKFVGEQSGDGDDKADPDRPIPFPLHVDLAAAIRKIQR